MFQILKNKIIHILGGYTEQELLEQRVELVDESINDQPPYGKTSPLHPDSKPLFVDYKNDSSALELRILKLENSESEQAMDTKFNFLDIYNFSESAIEVLCKYYKQKRNKGLYIMYRCLLIDILNHLEGLDRLKLLELVTTIIFNIESAEMDAKKKQYLQQEFYLIKNSLKQYFLNHQPRF